MLRKGLLTDRQKLICRLEQETGFKAVYAGAPTFRYSVGPCTIFRDGSLEVPDGMADEQLLRKLEEEGIIESAEDLSKFISFPVDCFQGKQLVNLTNLISARSAMINKAIGVPNAFHMSAALMREKQTVIRPENEKYTFRVWLNAIGMKGDAYGKAREMFLEKLDGDGTYRTPDQREAYNEKVRQRRCAQPEFVIF